MGKKIVAGNWKMNMDAHEADMLIDSLKKQNWPSDVSVMIAPSFTNLDRANQAVNNTPITVVAQNMHQAGLGAYTGEVSAEMLKSIGVNTVIIGHSERRLDFGENEDIIFSKVLAAITNGMTVIFCFGEDLSQRESESHFNVVKEQIEKAIFNFPEVTLSNIIFAYEPIWAIGTGKTASPEQAQEMHAFVRQIIADRYSEPIAKSVSILYGGSVKPDNASEIFAGKDVDGGLIGGAALDAEGFAAIANSF